VLFRWIINQKLLYKNYRILKRVLFVGKKPARSYFSQENIISINNIAIKLYRSKNLNPYTEIKINILISPCAMGYLCRKICCK